MPDKENEKPKGPWAGKKPTDKELQQILAEHKAWWAAGAEGDPPNDLSEIDLRERDLEKAILFRANLQGANLRCANLQDVMLGLANSQEVNLEGANLQGAYCSWANLQEANLEGANLEETYLEEANLQKAFLGEANLQKAYLSMANLQKAFLAEANLQEAYLQEANFRGADLCSANLRKADLRGANLEKADVTQVEYDHATKCRGIRVEGCYGNALFKRFAQDQDFVEEFKARHPVWHCFWWFFADCGRSFGRWAFWSLMLIYGFAVLYFHGIGANAFDLSQSALKWSFNAALYCSAVTFTALGFGDVHPATGAANFWSAVEVALGYVWLGGLVSILAQKLARRS